MLEYKILQECYADTKKVKEPQQFTSKLKFGIFRDK